MDQQELYSGKFNLITPEGYEKLLKELNFLFEVERPKTVDEVVTAAAHGDRSENAEYIYGKKRLREIDKRMNFLKSKVDKAKVIDPAKISSDQVLFGACVTVEDDSGKRRDFFIFGEDEADPSINRISWRSPVGRALLFKRVDDLVEVHTPSGPKDFTIIAIAYT